MTDTQNSAAVEAAQYLAANLTAAVGKLTPGYGEVTGDGFQMMTMCAVPERLSDAINKLPEIAAAITAPDALADALAEALRAMVYETTHLSPMETDGSHWCRISAETLANARTALGETK